jgi:hypothetical protein
MLRAIRRAGSARPSSLRAFFLDSSSRCRAARMLSRHSRRAKRSRTKLTRRLSVQRGGGSAPATGGAAAACWAVRTASPRAASIRGQKGGGHRCADTSAPRGRARCRHAPSPSLSADDVRFAWQAPSHPRLAQSRARREIARASGEAGRAAPNRASPPLSDPSGWHQHITPVRKKPLARETRHMGTQTSRPSQQTTGPKLDGV